MGGNWTIGYLLDSGNVATIAGSSRFETEDQARELASQRNREKPFLTHVAVRTEGALYAR